MRALVRALVLLLLCLAGCPEDAGSGGAVGDPCETSTECRENICHWGICVAANPAPVGAACRSPGQCLTFRCINGLCADGNSRLGEPCRFADECTSKTCTAQLCALAAPDGGSDGPPPPPRDGGSDAPQPDAPPADLYTPDAPLPDAPPPDVGPCQAHSECNDNLACTDDICGDAGVCTHVVTSGWCLIGNVCFADGAANPANSCQQCTASASTTSWSSNDSGSCTDGDDCTYGDACSGGTCQGTSYSCNDNSSCTTDVCTGTGPGPGGCTFALSAGFCLIGGTCYASGTAKPGDSCSVCSPAKNTSLWSPASGCVSTLAGSSAGMQDGPASAALFNEPMAVAANGSAVYVADRLNGRIRSISSGQVATVAAHDTLLPTTTCTSTEPVVGQPHGLTVQSSGAILFTREGCGRISRIASGSSTVENYTNGNTGFLDGLLAVARFNSPTGLAVDSGGAVFVGDAGNHRIRRIHAGTAATAAGSGTAGYDDASSPTLSRFNGPRGVAVDSSGNVYIADTGNHVIRVYDGSSVKTAAGVAGAPGFNDANFKQARFNTPTDVAVNGAGNVYVADSNNHRIRIIEGGQVRTLCGTGVAAFADGPASTARFNQPTGIALDAAGNIFVADRMNHRIRVIAP